MENQSKNSEFKIQILEWLWPACAWLIYLATCTRDFNAVLRALVNGTAAKWVYLLMISYNNEDGYVFYN